MVKIPDVLLNDVMGNQGRYALSNVNTGVNYARPVSNGVDFSGLTQGLAQAAQGIEQFKQNEQRNQYATQLQQEKQKLLLQKQQKEKEVIQRKYDKANSDAFILGNKTDIVLQLNKLAKDSADYKTAEEAQNNFITNADKMREMYTKDAPNETAKTNVTQIFEGLKQTYAPVIGNQFAKKEAQQRKTSVLRAVNSTVEAVINNEIDWRGGISNLNEILITAQEFIGTDKTQEIFDKTTLEIKNHAFDAMIRENRLGEADAILKDEEYKSGFNKDDIELKQETLFNAVKKDKNYMKTDPVSWFQKNAPDAFRSVQNLLDFQKANGIDLYDARLLSNEEAEQLHDDLKNANGNYFLQIQSDYIQKYGQSNWRNIIRNDLKGDKNRAIPKYVQYALDLDPIQDYNVISTLVDNFKNPDSFNENFKKVKITNGLNENEFNKNLFENISDTIEAMRNERLSEGHINYAYNMASDIAKAYYIKTENEKQAIEMAKQTLETDAVFISSGNGKNVRIPSDYANDIENIQLGLQAYQKEANIDNNDKISSNYFGKQLLNFSKEKTQETAYWIPIKGGMGLIDSQNGSAIKDLDTQKPIIVNYKDLIKKGKSVISKLKLKEHQFYFIPL